MQVHAYWRLSDVANFSVSMPHEMMNLPSMRLHPFA
jgi:hypothetical protein